ncbi:ArdC-like ssDNA-binding domain-containing protein, partial [Komagataeibacter swingsii]
MARTERTDIHQSVTDRIIRELEAGTVPWVCPWSRAKCGIALPRNAATDRAYCGINILMLWGSVEMQGFSTQKWLTFRQAHAQGGNVRKGEKGTTVFYADRFTPKSEAGSDEPRQIPFLKRFTV